MYSNVVLEKYPERFLLDREYAELCVITGIVGDLSLIDDYNISDKDFLSRECKILARVLYSLNKEKYKRASQLEIKTRLTEEEKDLFKEYSIWSLLADTDLVIDQDNFLSNLDLLYMSNIFKDLLDRGQDIFYSMNIDGEITTLYDKFFKNSSSNELKDYLERQVDTLATVILDRGIQETIVNFTDEYIDDTLSGALQGTHFEFAGKNIDGEDIIAFPTLSKESNGFLNGTLSMLAGYSNVGKSTFLISLTMSLVESGEKVLLCSNEQKEKPFLDNFLMWIVCNKLKYNKLTKNKLRLGKEAMTDEDIAMIRLAQKLWREEYYGKIAFISLPSARMEYVLKKFKEYHARNDYSFFIYDTFKLDFSRKSESYWIGLIEDSRMLSEFANRYNAKVFATMQCALHTLGQLFLDANVLSNSKQVKEILQNLYLIRDMYEEEMDESSKFYCEPYTVNREMTEYGLNAVVKTKCELDPNKNYKIVFIDKTREGITSHAGNYAVVIEFDGARGIAKEVCLCKPKRKKIS